MARYSSFKYSKQKYGKSTVTETGDYTWVFLVDWNGDGSYDGTNEAAWMAGYRLKRGREEYLSSDGGGFEHMVPDTVTLKMTDPYRRYDPRNTVSPLYPNVSRGVKCQIAVYDNSVDPRVRYTRFTGYIDDITASTLNGEVKITCKGNLQTLADYKLTFKAAHINTTIHDAFIDLLDDAGYPGIDTIDADVQPIRSFSVDRDMAGSIVGKLADAALGQFFVDVNGKARFYSRSHNYSPGTLPNIDEDIILKDFSISQPWENVFNKVDVICNKQTLEQPCVVFYLNDPLKLEVDQTVYIYPSFESANDISIGAAEAFENADGTGANILASVQLTVFEVGPMGGRMGFYTSSAGYLTKLEIRGRKWKDSEEIFSHDAAGGYGNRKFTLESPFLQDRNYANAFMGILWGWLDDDRESLVIQLENRPTVQFVHDLLTKINITSPTYNIDADYWIMGIEEEWLSPTGQAARTTFYLSKIINDATSISPAIDIFNVSLELPAPLGLDNPAGDEQTQEAVSGAGSESGEGTAPLKPRACSGSALMPANSGASMPSGTTSWNLIISHIETDPDEMLTIGSKYITIPEDGDYEVSITGYAYASMAYSGDGDAAGLSPFTTTLSVVGDPALGGGSTKVSDYKSTARMGKGSTPDWSCYIPSSLNFIDSLTKGQTLYALASISNAGTSGLSGNLTYRYYYYVTVKKIRETKA